VLPFASPKPLSMYKDFTILSTEIVRGILVEEVKPYSASPTASN